MDEDTKKVGKHYQLPLPLKNHKKFPNNRYIPHHGKYYPSKPGKIRVVFDCSAKFKEVSLNKNLMSGPVLTNQIVGVLTRFC